MKNRIALLLITTVCILQLPIHCFGAELPHKEEVIYANLDSTGDANSVCAVNILNIEKSGTYTDYGNYSDVKNMTGYEELSLKNDEVSLKADQGKIYYQGDLKDATLPWNIIISYSLNDKEISPEDLPGESGKLKINMDITKNPKGDSSFFDTHSLQITALFDSNKAENIKSEGATFANVGSDKQLSYIVLPGKESHIEITSDVTDFEMEGISVNAVPLRLNIDISSLDKINDVNLLVDATNKLDGGAKELLEGTDSLKSGADNLISALFLLSDKGGDLSANSTIFKNNLSKASKEAETFKNTLEPLAVASPEYYGNIYATVSALSSALSNLDMSYTALDTGISGYTSKISDTASHAKELDKGTTDIYNGTKTLKSGTEKLNSNLNSTLNNSELRSSVDDLTRLAKLLTGEAETHSFTSEKNTNVSAVQFVMKTASIKDESKATDEEATEEKTSIFEKFLNLFR